MFVHSSTCIKENELIKSDCPLGSFGVNCNTTCVANYFGKFCQETCNCTVDQYCDTVKGCLPKQRNTSEILLPSMYVLMVLRNSCR